MRYRLRTLLIVMTLAPPLLAGIFLLTTKLPSAIPGILCFAVFWLLCGFVWLGIMRAVEGLLEGRQK